jgi:hypothetical protein
MNESRFEADLEEILIALSLLSQGSSHVNKLHERLFSEKTAKIVTSQCFERSVLTTSWLFLPEKQPEVNTLTGRRGTLFTRQTQRLRRQGQLAGTTDRPGTTFVT